MSRTNFRDEDVGREMSTHKFAHQHKTVDVKSSDENAAAIRGDQWVNSDSTIADALIQSGAVAAEKIAYAAKIRSRLENPKSLSQVIVDLKLLSLAELKDALRRSPSGVDVPTMLVEFGHLSLAQLSATVKAQANSELPLNDVFVSHHGIKPQIIAEYLSIQIGCQNVNINLSKIDRSQIAKCEIKVYKQHCFLPVAEIDGKTRVAFADPFDQTALAVAKQFFGADLEVAISTKSQISDCILHLEEGAKRNKNQQSDDNQTVRLVNDIISSAIEKDASDIHLEPSRNAMTVRYRIDGVLIRQDDIPKELVQSAISRLKIMTGADISEKRRHQGGRLVYNDPERGHKVDVRASFFVTIYGEKVVLRLMNMKGELLALEQIGMAPKMLERFIMDAIEPPSGVVMVTGPTGSGKTTTLYSAVNHLNNNHTSIITAEDPVEYVIEGIAQCSINDKLDMTFDESIRHMVRQDPDVIVLGEIRDRHSAESAIQAALTGHKVITTFHTEDSIGGLLRLMNMDIEAFLISSTVVSIVAQRLIRRVCKSCAKPYTPSPAQLNRIGYKVKDLENAEWLQSNGCEACHYTGYRGRVGVFELLVLNEKVKEAILANKTSHEIRNISVNTSGLVTLLEDAIFKAASGHTTLDEAFRHLPRLSPPRPLNEIKRLLGA